MSMNLNNFPVTFAGVERVSMSSKSISVSETISAPLPDARVHESKVGGGGSLEGHNERRARESRKV